MNEKEMNTEEDKDAIFFGQLLNFKWTSFVIIGVLTLGVALFLLTFIWQLRYGLSVTGMNVPVYWAMYIPNFIFFVGIAHGGAVITAVLRLFRAEWRRPITRLSETITVFALLFAMMGIAFDAGRSVDRAPLNLIKFGRFQSPLIWDVLAISTYLILSGIALYVALIPDIAHIKNRITSKTWKWFYDILSLNWRGTRDQWIMLEKTLHLLALLIIPTMVAVSTVVAYVFSMSIQPMWHESLFGILFVMGAVYSGVANVIVIMYLVRRFYHMESLITPRHFDNMGKLLLLMSFVLIYITETEYLTAYYGAEPAIVKVLADRVIGRYFPLWIFFMLTNFVIPIIILSLRRTPASTFIASMCVLMGMWVERFLIVIPTVINPRLPYAKAFYNPTWVEYGATIGSFSFFILLYYLFTKFFPIVPIWEVNKEEERALAMHDGGEGSEVRSKKWNLSLRNEDENSGIAQYIPLGIFLSIEIFIVAILLNGVRNGVIFGLINKEIGDLASLGFSIGVNAVFLPIHLTATYSVGRLMWTLIRGSDKAKDKGVI